MMMLSRFCDSLNAVAPENATIHANLGTALFQLNRFAEAKTNTRG